MHFPLRWLNSCVATLLLAVLPVAPPALAQTTGPADTSAAKQKASPADSSLRTWLPPALTNYSRWSFEFAVGIIGDTTPGDYLSLGFDRYDGPGSGLTYNLTAAYQVYEFDWKIGRTRLQPELEVPFMLTLVDEDTGEVIPDFNLGLVARWRDFPWHRYVYTTVAIGAGLSYSTKVWTSDYGRHPEDDRSTWKFWLPVEMTFALPRYARHQLVLFIDHQSGGTMFDRGGIDAWGFGYRFLL